MSSLTRPRPSFNLKASFDSMELQLMSNLLNTVSKIPNYITNSERISGLTQNEINSIASSLSDTSKMITSAISQGYFTQPDANKNVFINSLVSSDADLPVYQNLFSFPLGNLFDSPVNVAVAANNIASLAFISASDASITAASVLNSVSTTYAGLLAKEIADEKAAATAIALAISSPSDINSAAAATANNISAISTLNAISSLALLNNSQVIADSKALALANAVSTVNSTTTTLANAKITAAAANNSICLSFPLLPVSLLSVGGNASIGYMMQLHQLNDAISIYIDSQTDI